MPAEVFAHSLFSGPDRGLLENVVLRHESGVITSISEGTQQPSGPRSLVLPAFVNAHDHARPTASSFGAIGMPLESWILRSALGTPVDPYLTAASALARSARAGCASMMIHYTRPSGTMPLVEEAQAMPLDTLEEIRLFSNLETAHHKLLQIVLFGQPELDESLNLPRMRQLKERITHSFKVPPLDPTLLPSDLQPTPVLGPDLRWEHPEGRPQLREAWDVDRDRIFADLYRVLGERV